MIHRRFALVLVAAVSFAGCRRGGGKADVHYDKARALYQKLYAAEFDDAYGDPKMEDVVGLLKQVDSDSIDSGAAQSMLDGIQHGREVYAGQKANREKRAAAMAAPIVMPNIDPVKVLAASSSSANRDAGSPVDSFGTGAIIAELNRSSGGCLVAAEPFTERVTNKTGTVYRLAGSPQCAQLLPGFVNQEVLVVDGAVYRRLDAGLVQPPSGASQDGGTSGSPGTATPAATQTPAATRTAPPQPPSPNRGDPSPAGQAAPPDAGY